MLGASFIGLEVAAALRARKIEVHVVAPEKRPMERILGAQMGDFVRALHEEHGVVFHFEDTASAIERNEVMLNSGKTLTADIVVAGIGVRPRTQLAEKAGIALDRGILVDSYLKTSVPEIFAAGDIARRPDPIPVTMFGPSIGSLPSVKAKPRRSTCWGSRAVRRPFRSSGASTMTWPINYVGHAEQWDDLTIDGDIAARDFLLRYKRKGRVLAVASIYRDLENLRAELAMEQSVVQSAG